MVGSGDPAGLGAGAAQHGLLHGLVIGACGPLEPVPDVVEGVLVSPGPLVEAALDHGHHHDHERRDHEAEERAKDVVLVLGRAVDGGGNDIDQLLAELVKSFLEPEDRDDGVGHVGQGLEGVHVFDGQVDLDPGLGREGGPGHGLDVEPEAVLLLPGPEAVDRLLELFLGVEEVGPGEDDGRVELALGYAEHSVAQHLAEGLVDAVAVVLGV